MGAEMTERRRVEVNLPEPDAVEADGLRRVGEVERLPEGLGLGVAGARLLDEEPEVHAPRVARPPRALQGQVASSASRTQAAGSIAEPHRLAGAAARGETGAATRSTRSAVRHLDLVVHAVAQEAGALHGAAQRVAVRGARRRRPARPARCVRADRHRHARAGREAAGAATRSRTPSARDRVRRRRPRPPRTFVLPMNSATKRVRGCVEELVGGADLGHAPALEHGDAVGDHHGLGLVVGDVERGDAEGLVQPPDLEAHLLAQVGVEVGRAARRGGGSPAPPRAPAPPPPAAAGRRDSSPG